MTNDLITKQDAPNLQGQLDSFFEQKVETPQPTNVETPINVESKEAPQQQSTEPLTTTEQQVVEDKLEEIQSTEDDSEREALIAKFKADTGFDGDIDLTLDSFVGAVKSFKEKLQVYEEDEDIKAFAEHKAKGGTIETFRTLPKPPDYTAVREALTPDNIEFAEQIVRNDLTAKGMRPILIEAQINALKDAGELHDEAGLIVDSKEAFELEEYNSKIQSVNTELEAERVRAEESWNQVKNVLQGNVINGIIVSPTEMQEFKDYILPDKKTGVSKAIQARAALTVDEQLALDYIAFKRFNINAGEIKGLVKRVTPPKDSLSLNMLTARAKTNTGSADKTDELLSELGTLFKK